jgi:predicted RNA binding protein YcfA (HicA-like mRNA interferase family)
MGRRKYPPLTPSDVRDIVSALGFNRKRKVGSHAQYERPAGTDGQRRVVTIDEAEDQFDDFLIKSMIQQSGYSRDEFYGATRKTARRAGVALFVVSFEPKAQDTVVPDPAVD